MGKTIPVGEYLIHRLGELGINHVFGVPGDYVLGFYDQLVESELETVCTCTEAGAGFAADAYARVNGLGAVSVTYCVGGLNTLNAVAGAYAEKSPLIVISGAPGLNERARSPLLHHQVRDFNTQRNIFEEVTVAAVVVDDPSTAPRRIDEALQACLRHKRPIYLELPRDVVHMRCAAPEPFVRPSTGSDEAVLEEAVDEASAMLRKAKRPVVLGGIEIHRFGLQNAFLRLVERSGFPVAATLLGKSIIRENHPQYVGIYEGAMGQEKVRRVVERADCVLILGAFMTDINLGIYTAELDEAKTIYATAERIAIKRHSFDDVSLKDFIDHLGKAALGSTHKMVAAHRKAPRPHTVQPNRALSIRRFFRRMDDFLDARSVVICDIGDSLFGAAELTIQRRTEFLSPAYYTSMGFAVPAALGAQMNKKRLRPIVFVGDGAFQMTGQELSTVVRQGLNPIVFVLNNKGYTTERFINDGPYNDVLNWAYHRMPELLQAGWGREVHTEGDLEEALAAARGNKDGFSLINLHLDPYDRSHAMERLAKRLGERLV
jgi:indolepyruvate decarboxylase